MTTRAVDIIHRRRSRKARQQQRQRRSLWGWGVAGVLFLLLGVLPLGVTLGAATVIYTSAIRDLPAPDQSQALGAGAGLTELYDRSGTTLLLTEQSNADRRWWSLEELPPYVLRATLRAEDAGLMELQPPSTGATFQRLWRNLLVGPLVPDRTLTGRLVRNVIAPLGEAPSVDDIGREIALVAEIQRRYTPEQILEWHLNTNDYGNQAYGIGAAAETYLGKTADALTLDEAALLAAIPLATQYNPLDNETAARGRQRDLLRAMRTAGDIQTEDFEIATTTETPILLAANQPQQIAPEFVAYARRQAQDLLNLLGRDGNRLVAQGGLRIITTLDLDLYYQSECSLRTVLARLENQPIPPTARDGRPCVSASYLPPLDQVPLGDIPDSATLVTLDVTTGEIRSMIGAATRLDKQPGLTLYPFVYFTGFVSAQDNPATMVLDIPRTFPGSAEGLIFQPANPDNQFRGPINLRDAMASWRLPPVVDIAWTQGIGNVLRRAHRIGLNSLGEDSDLSLLERGGQAAVLDMTYAYSVFASMGQMRGVPTEAVGQGFRQLNPVAVLRIEDDAGNILWEYNAEQVALNQVGVYPEGVGYLLNDILADQRMREDILGEAVSGLNFNRRAAVISGLTGDGRENWTVGYTPQFVTGVHLMRADEGALALDVYGMQGTGGLWRAVMQYLHDRDTVPNSAWQRPEDIIQLNVCDRSGLLVNNNCPSRLEVFLRQPGYSPAQEDTYWETVVINNQTQLLASASTPPEFQVSQLYFVPPPEALDWWQANNLELPPTDIDAVSQPQLFSNVQILQPQPFSYISGVVDIRGTLDDTELNYFQLSYGQGQNPTDLFSVGERQTLFQRGTSLGSWDTSALSGLYTLRLTTVRQDGRAESTNIQVIIDNTPPEVSLSAGEPGRVYRWPTEDAIVLEAAVTTDYATVTRVEFYHDGTFLGADTEAPFGLNWDITQVGEETFTAVAFDAAGNQASSTLTVEVVRS